MSNAQWILRAYPDGNPTLDTWQLRDADVPDPKPGEIVVRAEFLSVDPYMRGRISPSKGYTQGVKPGEVMQGGGVGRVVASAHPDWREGDVAESMTFGWQTYAVLTPGRGGPSGVNRIDPNLAPVESSLFWLGMPGLTAFVGLFDLAKPLPGDTVVVSAASGAVGQLVGQFARLAGCRVIGIVGSPDKAAWCRSIGFDGTIDYRVEANLVEAVRAVCPQGVNVFFDNTAGPIHDAVFKNLALHARVIICGRIALSANIGKPDIGERLFSDLIINRATMMGLLVFDHWHRRDGAFSRIAEWHREGRLVVQQDVLEGFERMPEAFLRLLSGQNFGKQLVRV